MISVLASVTNIDIAKITISFLVLETPSSCLNSGLFYFNFSK